jgi:hypothetical protein
MTESSAGSTAELPEAAEQALTAEQRELVEVLLDPKFDADAIARRLLADADHDQPD